MNDLHRKVDEANDIYIKGEDAGSAFIATLYVAARMFDQLAGRLATLELAQRPALRPITRDPENPTSEFDQYIQNWHVDDNNNHPHRDFQSRRILVGAFELQIRASPSGWSVEVNAEALTAGTQANKTEADAFVRELKELLDRYTY